MLRFILFFMFLLLSFDQSVFAQTAAYYKPPSVSPKSKVTEPAIEIQGYYWFTDLASEVKVTTNSLPGTDINFKNDLGIEDEDFADLRFVWKLASKTKLRLAYTDINYSGNKDIAQTILFDGQTYSIGARVNTNLDVKYLRLGWIQELISVGMSPASLNLCLLLELKGFLIEASLAAPSLGISESEELISGLPTLGVTFEAKLHDAVSIFAEASGLSAGEYGYLFDAEAGIKIIPLENLSIVAGYRMLSLKLEDDPDYAKLEITGPFFGITFRF